MSGFDAALNLGRKATRQVQSAHKPLVRLLRRRQRAREHEAFRADAEATVRTLARLARGRGPIIAGPWLAEVGYEVLYWIPFLRWFCDAHGVPPERLVAVSRGGMDTAYCEFAGRYVDIFDLVTPAQLATRNGERRERHEGGGQKQSGASAFDEELLQGVRTRLGLPEAQVCHPALFFRLFRNVWHGNLPLDVLWTHTRYVAKPFVALDAGPISADLPESFTAVKLYAGPALSTAPSTRAAVRALVARLAAQSPVVVLDTDLGIDEHRDFDLRGIPGVTTAGALMTPRTNLAVQLSLIARSRQFVGTCGGLAWLAPFLGIPAVGVYDSDEALATHLFTARQAGRAAGAAPFSVLDLRAAAAVGALASDVSRTPIE